MSKKGLLTAVLLSSVLPVASSASALGEDAVRPFGSSIFETSPVLGGTALSDPDRKIGFGDRVLLRLWGAKQFESAVLVDAEGSIFVPEVGPIEVKGKTLSEAQGDIKSAVSKVFKATVSVYATLADVNPESVFVTGNVARPGRYQGGDSDTVLDFLSRAGGILDAGSFRDIDVIRGENVVEEYDLYDFLLRGELDTFDFQDNDTIVVGYKNNAVSVTGGASNLASFEFLEKTVTGQDVINKARIESGSSHALVRRSDGKTDKEIYLKISDFRSFRLLDGDEVSFKRDVVSDTVSVSIVGEVMGQKQFSVKKGASLKQVLSFIAIDPNTVDVSAIHIERPSVAVEQKEALESSLMRLQRAALREGSMDPASAQVRASEATMIASFVDAAREVQFPGKIVLSRQGKVSDVILQDGDRIIIPRKTDVVVVNGEVMVTNAFLFEEGMRVKDYVNMSGGLTHRASKGKFVLSHLDGSSAIVDEMAIVRNGDQVIALPKIDRKGFILAQQIVGIVYQIAVGTGAIINP